MGTSDRAKLFRFFDADKAREIAKVILIGPPGFFGMNIGEPF